MKRVVTQQPRINLNSRQPPSMYTIKSFTGILFSLIIFFAVVSNAGPLPQGELVQDDQEPPIPTYTTTTWGFHLPGEPRGTYYYYTYETRQLLIAKGLLIEPKVCPNQQCLFNAVCYTMLGHKSSSKGLCACTGRRYGETCDGEP